MAWLDRIDERQLRGLRNRLLGEVEHAREFAAGKLRSLGQHAAVTAERTAQEALEVGQRQAGLVAAEVARQGVRTGRAIRHDPLPALVAAFAAVMLFNLISSRPRARKANRSRR